MLVALFSVLLGCQIPEQKSLPEKPSGLWELQQEETTTGQVDGLESVLQKYPGCTWGRVTWTFSTSDEPDPTRRTDSILVGLDVLCPAAVGDYYGCEVNAKVPATWDEEGGKWTVAYPVAARARTIGVSEEAIAGPTSCEVSIPAGEYPVVRIRNQDWRWEMRTPAGKVLRLALPKSDRPDFVSAIQPAQVTP